MMILVLLRWDFYDAQMNPSILFEEFSKVVVILIVILSEDEDGIDGVAAEEE